MSNQTFQINTIFPATVLLSEGTYNFTQDELYYANNALIEPNLGNRTSRNKYVLEDLPNLKQYIMEGVNFYAQNILSAADGLEFYITQSWLNYTSGGEYHHKHSHRNSIISGVIYFETVENDRIVFEDDLRSKRIDITPKEWNLYNSEVWWFSVQVGKLILFNSSLTHMVPTVTEGNRVSLAFNTFVRGNIGSELALTALKL